MWMITHDYLDNKDVKVCSRDWRPEAELNQRFRLFDDDGVLCYEGVSNDSESEAGFDPLDDYGTPNVGCTYIQYLRGGKWETL